MGRRSTKENKNLYQQIREELGWSREKAEDMMGYTTADHIEKIENGTVHVQPEDVLDMAKAYKAPQLCNYYCTHDCAIGKEIVQPVEMKQFSQIAIETLNGLNKLEDQKKRLLEIVEDGEVTADEMEDFLLIKSTLEKIVSGADSLQLWIQKEIADGKLDQKDFTRMQNAPKQRK